MGLGGGARSFGLGSRLHVGERFGVAAVEVRHPVDLGIAGEVDQGRSGGRANLGLQRLPGFTRQFNSPASAAVSSGVMIC